MNGTKWMNYSHKQILLKILLQSVNYWQCMLYFLIPSCFICKAVEMRGLISNAIYSIKLSIAPFAADVIGFQSCLMLNIIIYETFPNDVLNLSLWEKYIASIMKYYWQGRVKFHEQGKQASYCYLLLLFSSLPEILN